MIKLNQYLSFFLLSFSILSIQLAQVSYYLFIVLFFIGVVSKKVLIKNNILLFVFPLFIIITLAKVIITSSFSHSFFFNSLNTLYLLPLILFYTNTDENKARYFYSFLVGIFIFSLYFFISQKQHWQLDGLYLFFNDEHTLGFCLIVSSIIALSLLLSSLSLQLEKIIFLILFIFNAAALLFLQNQLILLAWLLSSALLIIMKNKKIGIVLLFMIIIAIVIQYQYKLIDFALVDFRALLTHTAHSWSGFFDHLGMINIFYGGDLAFYYQKGFSNIYLTILASFGLIGLSSFLLIWFGLLSAAHFTLKRKRAEESKNTPYLQACLSIFYSFLFLNFFTDLFALYHMQFIIFCLMGLMLIVIQEVRSNKKQRL